MLFLLRTRVPEHHPLDIQILLALELIMGDLTALNSAIAANTAGVALGALTHGGNGAARWTAASAAVVSAASAAGTSGADSNKRPVSSSVSRNTTRPSMPRRKAGSG